MITLSDTRIPFNGTCWMTREQRQHAKKTGARLFIVFDEFGRRIRDESGRWLIKTRNLTFDQLPLGYLDWLAGQPWIYGSFQSRLCAYLKRPCIQRELDDLFSDPEDDSRKPLFIGNPTDQVHCKIDSPRADKWHGQPTSKDPEPDHLEWFDRDHPKPAKPKPPITKWNAWLIAAETLAWLEQHQPDPADLLELDFKQIGIALNLLPPDKAKQVREQYRLWRACARAHPVHTASAEYGNTQILDRYA